MNANLDRYFKKPDGNWGMVHLGCLDTLPREDKDKLLRPGAEGIVLEAPLHIGYPVVVCSVCGITGRLGSWNENLWLEPARELVKEAI